MRCPSIQVVRVLLMLRALADMEALTTTGECSISTAACTSLEQRERAEQKGLATRGLTDRVQRTECRGFFSECYLCFLVLHAGPYMTVGYDYSILGPPNTADSEAGSCSQASPDRAASLFDCSSSTPH